MASIDYFSVSKSDDYMTLFSYPVFPSQVNCPFYFKIGACRHSDRCSRLHHKPAFSPTLLVKHVYRHPVRQAELQQASGGQAGGATSTAAAVDPVAARDEFFDFFEDVYMEFGKFGPIEEMHVVDNLGDHMIGHVYIKFVDEEMASDALQVMNGRYYDGRRMEVEFSPVTDFTEARCRDYDEESCARGGFCNFIHAKPVPGALIRSLEEDCEDDRRREQEERYKRERREERHHHKKHKKRKREKRDRDDRKRSRRSRSRSRSGGDDGDDDSTSD